MEVTSLCMAPTERPTIDLAFIVQLLVDHHHHNLNYLISIIVFVVLILLILILLLVSVSYLLRHNIIRVRDEYLHL